MAELGGRAGGLVFVGGACSSCLLTGGCSYLAACLVACLVACSVVCLMACCLMACCWLAWLLMADHDEWLSWAVAPVAWSSSVALVLLAFFFLPSCWWLLACLVACWWLAVGLLAGLLGWLLSCLVCVCSTQYLGMFTYRTNGTSTYYFAPIVGTSTRVRTYNVIMSQLSDCSGTSTYKSHRRRRRGDCDSSW
jgi:hypothetical protein